MLRADEGSSQRGASARCDLGGKPNMTEDARRYAPAVARNREPGRGELMRVLAVSL